MIQIFGPLPALVLCLCFGRILSLFLKIASIFGNVIIFASVYSKNIKGSIHNSFQTICY